MIALVALDASAAGRRLWLGAVMEEVAEVAKTAKAAQARKTLSAQMVVVSGARSNLQAASARLAARSGRTTKGRPRGGRAGRGPSAAGGICSSSKPSGHPFTAVVLNSNLIRATELRAYKGLGAYQQPQDCSSVDPLEQTSPSFLPLPIIVRCMAALCCTLALEGEYYLTILPVFLVQHTHVREESAACFCC